MAMSRRRLLQSLGVVGGASMASALGWSSMARSASAPSGLRVLFYVTSHGTVYKDWKLRPPGMGDDTDWEAPLADLPAWGPILEPLQRHADNLLVLDGVSNVCAMTAGFNEHQAGNAACQTGRVPTQVAAERSITDGNSIDQALAERRTTPFPSLEYAVGGAPVAYTPGGTALPFESDPVAAWQRLFPSADPDDRALQLGGAVLEFAAQRYGRISDRMAGSGSWRMSQHGDLLVDLAQRRALAADIACDATERPTEPPGLQEAEYPAHQINAFYELLVAALSCGLTDIGSLRVDHIPPATVGAPPGNLHADIAHAVADDPWAEGIMSTYQTFHAAQFAHLLDLMQAIPDGDGTLLDNTLVVWHNEMGTADHWFSRVPVVMAGAKGVLRTGRVMHWADRGTMQALWFPQPFARPHQQVLATVAQAAGLDVDRFGTEWVQDIDGNDVDCTGILEGVLA